MGRQINGRISSRSFNDIENLNFMSISYESNKRDVNRKLDNSSKNEFREQLMPKQIKGRTFYMTAEACQKAGISKATLFRWISMGIITDTKTKDRNGWRLFSEEDVANIRAESVRISRR